MPGLMQNWPLTLDRFLEHARRWHGSQEVVTRTNEGPVARCGYADIHRRARQLSHALLEHGIAREDRVATLAFNSARHLEAWYGIMGIGAVCHTLNPRLPIEQLAYIVSHAGDRLILADALCQPIVEQLRSRCASLERVVYLNDDDYEQWIAGRADDCAWGGFPEDTAAGLCYTSGTTGEPKGVLYSHRSNYLHALTVLMPEVLGFTRRDVVLAIVPMFHANAWGLTFAAPAAGAKLVLPGAKLDGASVFELMEREGVTFSAGVPTVWQGLMQFLEREHVRPTTLKRIVSGGAACPEALMRAYQEKYGIEVRHGWGMTEMSPVGTLNAPPDLATPALAQGRVLFNVDMKLTDDEGRDVAHDGASFGHLKVRGPAVARAYFRREAEPILDAEGWFDTGDIATIDAGGVMRITDRAKDVIKSGGEWISSIEIENAAAAHPKAALAAVIGVPHAKWGERPLLIVQLKPGESATAQEFLDFLAARIARWWMPEAVQFVAAIPLGATGKIDKKQLRASAIRPA